MRTSTGMERTWCWSSGRGPSRTCWWPLVLLDAAAGLRGAGPFVVRCHHRRTAAGDRRGWTRSVHHSDQAGEHRCLAEAGSIEPRRAVRDPRRPRAAVLRTPTRGVTPSDHDHPGRPARTPHGDGPVRAQLRRTLSGNGVDTRTPSARRRSVCVALRAAQAGEAGTPSRRIGCNRRSEALKGCLASQELKLGQSRESTTASSGDGLERIITFHGCPFKAASTASSCTTLKAPSSRT
jgi:hypothetical protein